MACNPPALVALVALAVGVAVGLLLEAPAALAAAAALALIAEGMVALAVVAAVPKVAPLERQASVVEMEGAVVVVA